MADTPTLPDKEHAKSRVPCLGVHASKGINYKFGTALGTDDEATMMDVLCARFERMLWKSNQELIDAILKRNDVVFKGTQQCETYGSSESVTDDNNLQLFTPPDGINNVPRFQPAPGVGPTASAASDGTSNFLSVSKFQQSQAVEPTGSIPLGPTGSIPFGSKYSSQGSAVNHIKSLDLDEEDMARKHEALQIDTRTLSRIFDSYSETSGQPSLGQFGWRRPFAKCVGNRQFEYTFAILIITNAIFIGFQVDWESRNPGNSPPAALHVLQFGYIVVFMVELLLRFVARGMLMWRSSEKYWNLLDAFLVIASMFEGAMEILAMATSEGTSLHVRIFRIVRVARLIRIFRILRVVRFIRGLRLLIFSIMCTLKSLVWAMLLLLVIIYVFGIIFTLAVGEYLIDKDATSSSEYYLPSDPSYHLHILREYYGTLPTSMHSLFETVSGGLDWGITTRALNQAGLIWNIVFLIYVAFVYFAVLNVVTGVFCHAAIESAQHDHDTVIQQHLTNNNAYVKEVKRLFRDLDTDASGTITLNEFERHFQDQSVQAYFASLDLDPSDAWSLFKLLDTNYSHQVNIEEFALGCLRLRGPAKRVDMEKLMYDHKRFSRGLLAFCQLMEHHVNNASEGEAMNDGPTVESRARSKERERSMSCIKDNLEDLQQWVDSASDIIQLPPDALKAHKRRHTSDF